MLSKNQVSYIRSLHQKKFRQIYGKFLVEGAKNVQELLHSTWTTDAIYCTGDTDNYKKEGVTVQKVSTADLSKISTLTNPDGAVAIANIPVVPNETPPLADGFHLLLDGISDPGNLGTIIRIADWFGWRQIFLSDNCVDIFNPKTVSAAKGSLFRVSCRYGALSKLIQEYDVPVYGAVLNGANVYQQKFPISGFLLIGNEANGISNEMIQYVNYPISIPSFGAAESLNAAVATGIIVSEIMRKRYA